MKKLFILAIGAMSACLLQAAPLDVSGFAKSIVITVPSTSIAQGVSLADFPVLVRLSTAIDGFSYSDFQQQNGADLAFLDARGNVLAHEIDTWNTEGESLVWVKVPAFSLSTRIYMVYGNDSYSSSVAATNTWSGFTGVWHMKEESGAVADATGHGLSATPSGTRAEYNVGISGGVIGMARQNGGNGGNGYEEKAYLSIPDYDTYNLGDTFTASGFFRVTAAGGWYRLFSRKTSTGGWGQETHSERTEQVYVYGAPGSMPTVNVTGIVGNWVHLAFVYSGSICKVYANGQLLNTLSITPASDNGKPLSIGCTSDGGDWCLYGDYDEARLCDGELSADRIAADYATATDADFLSYGAAETCTLRFVDPSSFSKFVQITASSSAVPGGGVVGNFPALVRLSEGIDGFDYSDFMAGGADLVFTDADGAVLASEIDTWDTEGTSLVWVKVPFFENGMSLYAYWGASSASSVASTNAWSGFAGVWHMNESGSTAEPDVSGNGLDATPAGDTPEQIAMMTSYDGVVGTSRRTQTEYDSSMHNRFVVPAYSLGGTFTVSCWVNEKIDYGWHRIFTCKEGAGDSAGWHIECGGRNSGTATIIGSGSRGFDANIGSLVDHWTHLAFVFEGSEARVYTNGVLCASGAVNEATASTNGFAIGGTPLGRERTLEGYFDEVRLGETALPAVRLAADYATVADAAFFSYGSVSVPAADPPAFDAPTIANDAGTLKVSVSMTSGTGTPYVRFTSGSGSTDMALSETAVTGPQSYVVAVPGTLASDKTYSFAVVGVNTAGGEIIVPCEDNFYVGALVAAKVSDAAEDGPRAGSFSITRVDSHGDLAVNYALSGTAVAGTDYEGAASGTVTIPDGETSAMVSIRPKVNVAVTADTTVTLSISEGLYDAQASTATMTIANLAPVTKQEFLKRIEFTFPMEFLGEGEVLTNFPALVRLSTAIPGFSYSDFQIANGGDLMFTDSRGQVIPSEVDTWDDTGTSLVWVSVPTLTKGTRIKMYYGNGANPAGIPLAKWPGYAGVWHMGEASGTACDSTANGLDAEPVYNNPWDVDQTAIADGAVGKGRINQWDSTRYSVDYRTYGSDEDVRARSKRSFARVADYSSLEIGSRFTLSGWFKTIHGAEWTEYLACRRVDGNYWGWHIQRLATDNEGDHRVSVQVADGGGNFTIPNMRNNWVHLVFSFDIIKNDQNESIGEVTVYGNGELAPLYEGSARGSTFVRDVPLPLTFGNLNDAANGDGYNGQYDELRLKRGTSSASWAKAEYLTVTDATFVTASGAVPAVRGLMLIFR